ncbi:hypothetical protein D9613_008160 [Agrocybe pediades]|uniref:Uncharacterized protein n=1 Tax=Agrocybe pediades TaxID=84607 RepID=A0A8H4QN30_9AGAR|nr:hypothetical protein D9613_008160 [Agrocybe pediades]KAF9544955.1 hypothetical protein CPC08DRAFT_730185 [Agrocybe pediades]
MKFTLTSLVLLAALGSIMAAPSQPFDDDSECKKAQFPDQTELIHPTSATGKEPSPSAPQTALADTEKGEVPTAATVLAASLDTKYFVAFVDTVIGAIGQR